MSQIIITSKSTFNTVIDDIKGQCSRNFPDHVIEMEKFIRTKCAEYAAFFSMSELEIITFFEKNRSYNACNYYQEATFPNLNEVRIFETSEELMASIVEKKFRCPNCNQISTNPYSCNSNHSFDENEVCNWKSWGLFKTLGKGARVAVKSTFSEHGIVIDEIFMPIAWEKDNGNAHSA